MDSHRRTGRSVARRVACALGVICALLACAGRSAAQERALAEEPATPADGVAGPWRFQTALYLWLPEVQGIVGARGATANVDVDFTNLFDLMGDGDLFAGGGHVEVGYERFSFFLDAFGGTARPSSDVTVQRRPSLTGTADLTLNFAFFEFGPAYRILDWPRGGPGRPISLDVLTGGRFMYFYQSITLRGSGERFQRSANATSEWVDPFVGGRFSVPLVGELDLLFRGDIGGFGAGSELAWNLIGGFQYALPWQPGGARTSIVAVYKALSFDHDSGGGQNEIVTDLDLRGPALGLLLEF